MKYKTLISIIFTGIFLLDLCGCSREPSNTSSNNKPVGTTVSAVSSVSSVSSIQDNQADNYALLKSDDIGDFTDLILYNPDFDLNNYPVKYVSKRSILLLNKDYLTPVEISSIGNSIDRTVDELEAYLGTTFEKVYPEEKKIIYFIEPGIMPRMYSQFNRPVIFLSEVGGGKNALYAHETVHLLAGKEMGSLWIVEGLAVYLNEKFSEITSWPYYHNDIHETAKKYLRLENTPVLDLIGQDNSFLDLDPRNPDGEAYYVLSGSFVKFLDDQIGIKNLLDIYKRFDISNAFMELTNKDILEWKYEWLKSLNASEALNPSSK